MALSNPLSLVGGSPKQNAEKIIKLLDGEKEAYRDIVILNSSAALYIDGKVSNIKDGIDLSKHSIDSGMAKSALNKLVKVSNS
jgi:anthranilate phosphoribosyltransferase